MGRLGGAASGHPVVVGRERERSHIDAFVAGLTAGTRALMVCGEPGIGKTTLWAYGIERCRRAGVRVVSTRCAQDEVPLALGGLLDLLQDEAGRASASTGSPDVFAAGRAFLHQVRAWGAQAPVLIAVDDLQWLDAGSARALRYTLRRLEGEAVGILATTRTGAADPLDLASTLLPGRIAVVDVGGLSIGELRQLLDRVVDRVSRPVLHQIHQVAAGNPLHALEIARGLPAAPRPDRLPMPASLQAAIVERVEAAPPQVGALLDMLCASGPVHVDRLEAAMAHGGHEGQAVPVGHAVDSVHGLVVSGEQAGLLTVDDALVVRFAHPVIAATIDARMSRLTRRRMHARLATVDDTPDSRARHLALSASAPDRAAADLVAQAAQRAGEHGAYQTAAELAARAAELTPAEDGDARRERWMLRVRMLAAMGEVGQALSEASRLVDTLSAGPGRAAALVLRAELEDDDLALGVQLMGQALQDAGQDERLRGQVLDQLGWMQGVFLGDLDGGIERARQAHEVAVAQGDAQLRMSAAAGLSTMCALRGTPRMELAREAIAVEDELGRPLLWGGPRTLMAEQLLWSGELDAARQLLVQANGQAENAGNDRWLAYGLYNLAAVECAAGALRTADALVAAAMRTAHDCEDGHVESWTRFRRAMVSAWLGRAQEARAAATRRLAEADGRGERPGVARIRTVLGTLALSEDDVGTAVTELTLAVALMHDDGYANPGAIPALPNAVEALARAGDIGGAVLLQDRLDLQAHRLNNRLSAALALRSRGTLLLAQGAAEEAGAALQDAAATLHRLGYRPDGARAELLAGRAWTRAGRRARAAQVLDTAQDHFAQMGAALWQARAAEALERVAPGRSSGQLTPTERRVAELVAQGRRNTEIAGGMFISPATVEAHLTRIYRKLGVRSRSELTRRLLDGGDGLTPPTRS